MEIPYLYSVKIDRGAGLELAVRKDSNLLQKCIKPFMIEYMAGKH